MTFQREDRWTSAKQKFFEAVYSLVDSNKSLRIRLTYAALDLANLSPDELPEHMRADFKQLMHELTKTPLSEDYRDPPRDVTPREAKRLAIKILEMYTELLGGL
jgi:hypothetical protein